MRLLPALLSTLVVSLASLAAAVPAQAGADGKNLSPATACEPYGPDTTRAELQFSPTGVYNPGTAIEKVMCLLVYDQESRYADHDLEVQVRYRVLGPTQGRVTCTLYVGSASVQTEAVSTNTASGPLVSNGTRSYVTMYSGAGQVGYNSAPMALICAISPKTSMGAIYQYELHDTDAPPEPT